VELPTSAQQPAKAGTPLSTCAEFIATAPLGCYHEDSGQDFQEFPARRSISLSALKRCAKPNKGISRAPLRDLECKRQGEWFSVVQIGTVVVLGCRPAVRPILATPDTGLGDRVATQELRGALHGNRTAMV
jgi:hypothetical protein